MSLEDEISFADNPEPRCPVLLLVDCSSSMNQDGRMQALNAGLREFCAQVRADELAALRVEVCLITFASQVRVAHDFATIDAFEPPTLQAGGTTAMGAAIERGLDLLQERKTQYKEHGILYYRPWMFLLTDGAPTDTWRPAAERLRAAEAKRQCLVYAVGVRGADFGILSQISPEGRSPLQLKGLEFGAMFQWLSASVRAVSCSNVEAGGLQSLPPVSGWGEAPTL